MLLKLFLISFLSLLIGMGLGSLNACHSSRKRQEQLRQERIEEQRVLQEKAREAAIKAKKEAEAKLFTQLKSSELRLLVQNAVVYGYPLVLMDVSQQVMTGGIVVNEFRHSRKIPEAGESGAIHPSVDTLASVAWVDLSKEPVVLSVPATGQRYYMMSILDAWTNVFASPGTRTTGNGPGNFALVSPNWQGEIPVNAQRIQAPTSMALILGHTLIKDPQDYPMVHAIQNRFRLTPLSQFSHIPIPADLRSESDLKGTPVEIVRVMDAQTFLTRLSYLMKENAPSSEDQVMLESLEKIGVTPGHTVDFASLPSEVKSSLDQAVLEGYIRVEELARYIPGRVMNGWVSGLEVGNYGTNYDARAAMARMGLGANLPEDAIFPTARVDSDGLPLTGAQKYILHFAKGQWPPVNAFWSLTLYNERQGFVENPLHRYSLGSKNKLKAMKDGSLNIYIQATNPGRAKLANWLPAPQGEFNLMMRLYWPKQAVLNGEWQVPGVQKVRSRPAKLTLR
ncbi:MAG TPA: DUF1254 domain-containing protein [Pseudobdellovibrionaceae bacterium]|jgi:hypothetical protein